VIERGALIAGVDDVILATAARYTSYHLRWIFPFAALIALLTFVRDWRISLHDRVFRTCVALGLAGFIGCFPRPDAIHINFSAPLVCPLLAYGVNRLVRPWPVKYQYTVAALAIASLIPSRSGVLVDVGESPVRRRVPLPRGDITSLVDGCKSWRRGSQPRHAGTRMSAIRMMRCCRF
jgi:hypothetical protein